MRTRKDKELTFEEQRILQLEILKEVDEVCKRESIKYSLAFGTLLGAIRNNGYIPWDDDLDIMMPYEEMLRLRNAFHSENNKFYDIDSDKTYGNAFGNICSLKTYRLNGKIKERGLGIDIYPIVRIPQEEKEEELFFLIAERLQRFRSLYLKTSRFLKKHFGVNYMLGYHKCMKSFRDHLVSQYDSDSSRYYIIAGPLNIRDKMIYNDNLFDKMTTVLFEGEAFPVIAKSDLFLRMRYGNYLELPPVEERKPYHEQHYFWA